MFKKIYVLFLRRLHGVIRQELVIFLAYIMLIDPACLQQIAYASSQYKNISTSNWGSGNRTIEYSYDANGSCIKKITKETSTGNILETITYDYDLRNRMSRMTKQYTQDGDNIVETTDYTYNDDGILIKRISSKTVNGQPAGGDARYFLIDPFSPTGHPEVIMESDGSTSTTYTIGDDVVTQSANDYYGRVTSHILYDGHGSTRQLTNSSGAVEYDQVFNYDGYGVMLGYVGGEIYEQPITNLLYAGEYFDNHSRQYNLRARWYDPTTGRFNQADTFAGNRREPQSLHKYLYCYGNPINNIDPSGKQTLTETTTVTAITVEQIGISLWGSWMLYNAIGNLEETRDHRIAEQELQLFVQTAPEPFTQTDFENLETKIKVRTRGKDKEKLYLRYGFKSEYSYYINGGLKAPSWCTRQVYPTGWHTKWYLALYEKGPRDAIYIVLPYSDTIIYGPNPINGEMDTYIPGLWLPANGIMGPGMQWYFPYGTGIETVFGPISIPEGSLEDVK